MSDTVTTTTTDAAPTDPAPIKPGIYSSEAWLAFAVVALGGLLSSGLVGGMSTWGRVVALAIAALKAMTYTSARTQLKRAALPRARIVSTSSHTAAAGIATAATLIVGVLAISQMTACASSQVHTMTGAFVTCAKADLGQIVNAAGQDLEQDVASLATLNPTDLEAQLAQLVTLVGLDAVECAYAAVNEALAAAAPATAGGGSAAPAPATSAQAAYPGLARMKAWIEAQRAQGARGAARKARP